ncbi:flagellar motor switch protein FliM [Novosphingobium sp. PhB165]|uniref:FliM/FliN family flagellar motor C-terminal domain-containing protein n=1 Tax=Novosphingobium sp. PhB165 TaxID=2485105 RepID=UPI0010F0B16A|nr:FliM/FliN family flagellar motor C-terminal domain-containing protein [Novosphingobium sp. PhB165]TCM18857.1 flagellar motor switch protein FliM [Novosphingobium sp. PhB165]
MASSPTADAAGQRMKARHSADLLGKVPGLAELVPTLSLIGERLARALAGALAHLSGGEPPLVRVGMPMDGTLTSLQADLEGPAMHTLLVLGPTGLPLLATFEAHSMLRIVDRAFGGRGEAPETIPETLPLSALLLIERIEASLSEALGAALNGGGGGDGNSEEHRIRALRRDNSLRQLDPFPMTADLLTLALEIAEPGVAPWSLQLAFPVTTLAAATTPPRRPVVRRHRQARPDPTTEPFASVPIEVTAVLVNMPIAMSRLSTLRPGDVLPVAIARSIPLQVDGRTIASGAVGELDDRVAVQIAHAF